MNNYAISSDGIATALQDSASALMAAGNDLEQSVALIAAANKVVQDPNSVGSALRTISLRLRGTSVEVLEQMGEETDGAVTSLSKMQAKIKALTGVDILTDSGAYKDTYTILQEIGTVWEDMSDIDQAALLELMAGKNRANTLAAILGNMSDLEGAYKDALNANGSAMRENEAYLESIQGHIDILNNDVQTMWMNFMNTDAIKWIVHLLDLLVKIIDKVGLLNSVFLILSTRFVFKNFDRMFGNPDDIKKQTDNLNKLEAAYKKAQDAFNIAPSTESRKALEDATKNLEEYKKSIEGVNAAAQTGGLAAPKPQGGGGTPQSPTGQIPGQLSFFDDPDDASGGQLSLFDDPNTQYEQISFLDDYQEELTKIGQIKVKLGEIGTKLGGKLKAGFEKAKGGVVSFGKELGKALTSFFAMYAITTAINLVSDIIKGWVEDARDASNSFEVLEEKYQDLKSKLSECESELSSLESELETTNKQIEDLQAQGELSFVEQEELERLQAVSAELERQISMTETLQNSLQVSTASAAKNAAGTYMTTSFYSEKSKTERQKEAEEEGSKWGTGIGLVLGAAVVAGIGLATGGVGLMPVLAGAGVGSMAGGLAGGAIGSSSEGAAYDNELTVAQAIAHMDETRDKLVKARDDTYAAYASNPMDNTALANFEAASNELLVYDQQMGSHISQMSQYYNAIMTSWSNMTDEQKAQNEAMLGYAKMYGDMIDKYNIEMGGINAKVNAIDRIFGEEASDELKSVKKELEEMYKNGEKIDLKKAFGDNTKEYEDFVFRLHDMGIYVYELEESFYDLKVAEEEAAHVDFVDITKDIVAVTDAISGLKSAFDEFMEDGSSTPETLLNLEPYFQGSEELQKLYNEYVGIMLSGTASIEEAQDITAKLAQEYLDKMFSIGNITSKQKAVYINTLKELGIANPEEFIEHKIQKYVYKDVESEFDDKAKWTYGYGAKYSNQQYVDTSGIDTAAIAKKYGVEQKYVDGIVASLKERLVLEKKVNEIQDDKLDRYDQWYDDYHQAIEDYEYYDKIKNTEFTSEQWTFDPMEWDIVTLNGRYSTQWKEWMSNSEYIPLSNSLSAHDEEYGTKLAKKRYIASERSDAKERKVKYFNEGIELGFLDEDGNLIEGIKEKFQEEVDAAQAAVDAIDKQIEAEFFLDYDIKFAKDKIENSISSIKNLISEHNNLSSLIGELNFDGVQISEDTYNTLREQLKDVTVGTEDFFDAVDTSNGYTIKNSRLLGQLAKQSNKAAVAATKQAKSQAMLRYYDLFKKMRACVKIGEIFATNSNKNVLALHEEMNAIEKTIATYSRLETELLGVANAYNEFELAQQSDTETDYIGTVEGMATALGEAFSTGELGTETAQAAIAGLVPESVYNDLDTVEEKMAAIHEYFKNGKLSQYLDINFDDDGNIESAEMKLGNLRKFIEDGLSGDNNGDGINVFEGADWQHFEFSDEFLAGLNVAEDKLQYFADQMDVTKEVAFAFIESINDHDIEWLGGDYGSMFDILASDDFESKFYRTISGISDLNAQLAKGEITADEYAEAMYGLEGQFMSGKITQNELIKQKDDLWQKYASGQITFDEYEKAGVGLAGVEDNLIDVAYKSVTAWHKKTEELEGYKTSLDDYYTAINNGADADGLYTLADGTKVTFEELDKKIEETITEVDNVADELKDLEEPTEVEIQLAIDNIDSKMTELEQKLGFDPKEGTHYIYNTVTQTYEIKINEDDPNYKLIKQWVDYLNEQHVLEVNLGEETPTVVDTLQDLNGTLENIQNILLTAFNLEIDTSGAIQKIDNLKKYIDGWNLFGFFGTMVGASKANGTAHVSGTAHASGNWGLPTSEHNSLVGELGPEMVVDPHSGRYYTVGDTGAEMVDLPRGAIIFNHKQTESLLKNGHITSRGKAYAEGNAHVTFFTDAASSGQFGTSGWGTSDRDTAKGDDDKEIFDWIEVLLEEINDNISYQNALLENQVGSDNKNKVIDETIALNKKLYDSLIEGANKYYSYAENLLTKIPEKYRDAAQDGAIAIEEFAGDADKKTLEAIQEYREWVQKGDDAATQAQEVLTEISSLAKQAIDNITEEYENERSLTDNKINQYEVYNALIETSNGFESESLYQAMINESNKVIEMLEEQRDAMQEELDKRVESGEIKKFSQDWYDAVNDIAAADTEIIELTTDTKDYQDTINELHWDKFDALIGRIEAVSSETENLIDILSSDDLVDDDGNWTDKGIASLGLYAQKMEAAEVQAKKYEEEINYLNNNWQKLGYTEEEYIEKLGELKDGQYEAIKSYNDTKDAIVDLNKERVDAIKEGIQKEIDAYSELIEKKKEELDAEKDLYDFQKGVAEQQKDIADLERQLAALSADNSASARAKRAQLEADLAEAQQELQDQYYDRSISKQQEALDKELENLQEEKDAEIEELEEYLENTNQVVADSLVTIQANTDVVLQTLQSTVQEYGLDIQNAITSAIVNPWSEGTAAIQSFSEQFGISVSATIDELNELEAEFLATMTSIESSGSSASSTINADSSNYTSAEYVAPPVTESTSTSTSTPSTPSTAGLVSDISDTIYYGQTGDKVKKLQQALNELGYGNSGTTGLDGIFGSQTLAAVKKFQKAMGITVDGRVGPQTKGKFEEKGYAKGSKGVTDDQWAFIDELGEELQLVPGKNGRLEYIKKGTGIVPADMTERLMNIAMDPQMMIDSNRPSIGVHKEIHNTQIQIDNSIGELIHIDKCDQGTLPDVERIVNKALDNHMKSLNQSLRKFTR